MSELSELMLKSLIENKSATPEYFEYQHPRFGVLKFRAMNRAEKRAFLLSRELPTGNKKEVRVKVGDLLNNSEKLLYDCFELAPYAEKAKEQGLIVKYMDVLDALFEPSELLEMITVLFTASNMGNSQNEIQEDIDEVKK